MNKYAIAERKFVTHLHHIGVPKGIPIRVWRNDNCSRVFLNGLAVGEVTFNAYTNRFESFKPFEAYKAYVKPTKAYNMPKSVSAAENQQPTTPIMNKLLKGEKIRLFG